jgi:hypothetical protein
MNKQSGAMKILRHTHGRIRFISPAIAVILAFLTHNVTAQEYVDMCEGQSYRMQAYYNKTYTYQWQVKTKLDKSTSWPSTYTDIPRATKYYYSFTATDANIDYRYTCVINGNTPPATAYIEIEVHDLTPPDPPTNIVFSSSNYCPDDAPASLSMTASGGTSTSYIWSTSSTSLNGTEADPYVVSPGPDVSRTYYVRTTSGNACLPSNAYYETLNVYTESVQASSISASVNDICPGTSTTLTANGGSLGTNASWKWYVGTSYKYQGNPYTTPELDADVTYTVKASGTCNPTSSVSGISKDINVNDVPTIPTSINADDEELPAGGSTILRKNGGTEGSSTTWRWYTGGCGTGDPIDDGEIHNTGILSETRTYYLRGEDPCENTDCVSKTITVIALSIDTQPEDEIVCLGSNTSLSVDVSGSGVEYKWKKDGSDISGATSSGYSITGVALDDAGYYTCEVTDGITTLTSDAAQITVLEEPVITSQPAATVTACYGKNVQLEIVAQVTDAATFQWKKNTVDIGGETGKTLDFTGATPDDNGFYNCYIDDACGNLTTTGTNLTIGNELPEIDIGDDQVVCMNEGVMLSAASGYTSYLWSNGETTQNISVTNVEGDYFVTGTDNVGCEKTSNTVNLTFVGPYEDAEICIVTVDPENGKNLIVWERTPDMGIDYYIIYRESHIKDEYLPIAEVPFDSLSVYSDITSTPREVQHLYKISAVDTCGNESELSTYHKTMLLQYQESVEGVTMRWDKYELGEGEIDFQSYVIYRGSDSTSLDSIFTVSASIFSYNDVDPEALAGKRWYRVAGVKVSSCYPASLGGGKKVGTGPYNHSLSNLDDNKLKDAPASVQADNAGKGLMIYPNPFDSYTTLQFENPGNEEYTLYIRDLGGKLVGIQRNITGEDIHLERGALKPGYYHVEIIGENIFRGKLIVR